MAHKQAQLFVLILAGVIVFSGGAVTAVQETKAICDESRQTITYFSGNTVYSEALIDGRFVSLYWSGDGLPKEPFGSTIPAFEIYTSSDSWMAQPSYTQVHSDGWVWGGFEHLKDDSRGNKHFVLKLRTEKFPIAVDIHTILDGTNVLQRWLGVTNTGDKAFALMGVYSWSGKVWNQAIADIYDIGYQVDNGLGWFKWKKLIQGNTTIESNYGNGYDDPFFVLRNSADHEYMICHLAWTANWDMQFDYGLDSKSSDSGISFKIGPKSKDPLRIIKPNETVKCPKIHVGFVKGNFDQTVQAMHEHVRQSVLPKRPKERAYRIQYSVPGDNPISFYRGAEFNEQSMFKCIDVAAAIGAELFIIDHGWWKIYGDWEPSKNRYPQGLEAVADYVHKKGLLFGLYFEVEGGRGNWRESRIYKEHPEWFGPQDVLRFDKPEVVEYIENLLIDNIEKYDLDLYRHDFIPGYTNEWMSQPVAGFTENAYWRYYDNYYAMWERIHKKYPKLVLQMCTNGGAREDLDMMSRFHETYTVEDPDVSYPVSRIGSYACGKNQYRLPPMLPAISGKTVSLPPECLVYGVPRGQTLREVLEAYRFDIPEYVDKIPATVYRDLKTRMMFTLSTPWILVGVSPSLEDMSQEDIEYYKHYTDLYKNFIRPILPVSKVYHHAPVSEFCGVESSTWFAMEFMAPDKSKGWATIARLGNDGKRYLFKPKGLDPCAEYKVTFDGTGKTKVVKGVELMQKGLMLHFESMLGSELLLFESN